MDHIEFDVETGMRLLISFAIGTIIGFEREYHSKAAGLRTMIMICLGSTMFTMISLSIGGESPDRIASNIITGIGFLGAGVIFKDGLTITGITTATTIWISAALGMAVGAGEYFMAMAGAVVVLTVLSGLQRVTTQIERYHQARVYRITLPNTDPLIDDIDREIVRLKLEPGKKKYLKEQEQLIVIYEITGGEKKLNDFSEYLRNYAQVIAFEF